MAASCSHSGKSEFVLHAVPALPVPFTMPIFYLKGKEFSYKKVGFIRAALLKEIDWENGIRFTNSLIRKTPLFV